MRVVPPILIGELRRGSLPSSSPSSSTFYFLISTLSAVSPSLREIKTNHIMPQHDSIN